MSNLHYRTFVNTFLMRGITFCVAIINDTVLMDEKNNITPLTCKPITLWPAFNLPSSKRLACFSAYLTPMSMVVWKPFVFA